MRIYDHVREWYGILYIGIYLATNGPRLTVQVRCMYDYMSHNALFCHEQFGFRTGHSTELALRQLSDYLRKQMAQGGTPLNIYIYIYIYIYINYIDLSMAFDTLEHSIV